MPALVDEEDGEMLECEQQGRVKGNDYSPGNKVLVPDPMRGVRVMRCRVWGEWCSAEYNEIQFRVRVVFKDVDGGVLRSEGVMHEVVLLTVP